MQYVIRSTFGDHYDREAGHLTVGEDGLEYHVEEWTPDREAIVEALEEVAARETRPDHGGADDPDSVCGGYGKAPATDEDRLSMAIHALMGSAYPVRVEEVEP